MANDPKGTHTSAACAVLNACVAAHYESRRAFARALGVANDLPRALIEGQYKPGRENASKIEHLTADKCTCRSRRHVVAVELWDLPVAARRRRRAAA